MEGPLFLVESRHDVTNAQNEGAEYLSKDPAAGPCVADPFAVRSHYLETAGHFSRRGAVFPKKICPVGYAKDKGNGVLEDGAYHRVPYKVTRQECENKPYDREDDSVDDFSTKADPESGIHHFSRNGYTFPQLLHKEWFALTAHQSISELDEFIIKIYHSAFAAVFRRPRCSTF
jgi:hypothetical protein